MAGDVANAAVWAEADVFVGTLTAANPVNDADFGVDWEFLGLLSGEDGFGESRELESADHYAWGGILVATTRRNFKLTRTATVLEDNTAVYSIVWPGSTVTFGADSYTGGLKIPDLQHKFKVAFETRTGTVLKRVISTNYAQLEEVGELSESETSLAMRPLTFTIYPDSTGQLFDVFKADTATFVP